MTEYIFRSWKHKGVIKQSIRMRIDRKIINCGTLVFPDNNAWEEFNIPFERAFEECTLHDDSEVYK